MRYRRRLILAPELYVVARLGPDADVAVAKSRSRFVSVTRTANEVSIVCDASDAPVEALVESGFRLFAVDDRLPFEMVGLLRDLTATLADAAISLFVVSTFDTDYLLVKENVLDDALDALRRDGWQIDSR